MYAVNRRRKWFTGVVLTKREKGLLLLYSVFHFMVDLSTVYYMNVRILPSVFGAEESRWAVILYNMLAFAFPLPFGIWADKWNKNPLVSAAGLLLILAGYHNPAGNLISLVLISCGNGIFHVGGGLDVLNMSEEKYAPCGCFISTGALGVFLGTFFGRKVWHLENGITAFLIAGIFVMIFIYKKNHRENLLQNMPFALPFGRKKFLPLFLSFFFVVALRSYYGMILSYDWKKEMFWSVLFALAVMIGKMAGGILADCWGTDKVTASLGIAGVLALFSFRSPLAGILSVFLFNMTMPVTLLSMAKIFPQAKGFAFGVLTFALFAGFIPVSFQKESPFFNPAGLMFLCLISMALLYTGLRLEKNHD